MQRTGRGRSIKRPPGPPLSPERRMTTWHRLGTKDELLARVPFAIKIERHRIAVFVHEGRFTAISDICNHKGGPLSEGRVRGEFVMCPWHGWEYSVLTGKGPTGYDEEQVPVFAVEERADGVYVQLPPVMPRKLIKHKPSHLLEEHAKVPGAPPRVLFLSTTAMDEGNPRFSTSDALLEHALGRAKEISVDTQLIKLRQLNFKHCEGNYSKASHACTWPCAITERDPEDQLTPVYEGLVHWADVVLISTPIRWGNASSLYYKMVERLNCVQNQVTIHNKVLIRNKVAAFIITGGQDNIQAVAGSMFTFWSELGFVFPPFPFIAHSRGWDAEDMQNNVHQVKMSDMLREAAYELLDRSLDFWTILDRHKAEMDKPMERAGRKANALRPARSIGLSISALWRSRMVQKSSERSSSSYAASRSVSLSFTWRTLFCMSSASQPRECAMNGNGGNTKPSSDQKVNMPPATAWMLSCPPVMMNAATLFLMSTRLWIVIWFCTQFNRSIIL